MYLGVPFWNVYLGSHLFAYRVLLAAGIIVKHFSSLLRNGSHRNSAVSVFQIHFCSVCLPAPRVPISAAADAVDVSETVQENENETKVSPAGCYYIGGRAKIVQPTLMVGSMLACVGRWFNYHITCHRKVLPYCTKQYEGDVYAALKMGPRQWVFPNLQIGSQRGRNSSCESQGTHRAWVSLPEKGEWEVQAILELELPPWALLWFMCFPPLSLSCFSFISHIRKENGEQGPSQALSICDTKKRCRSCLAARTFHLWLVWSVAT